MKRTCIIILNYNNAEDTINCIESIEKFNTADIKYVVVDNHSTKEGCTDLLKMYLQKRFEGEVNIMNEGEPHSTVLPYMNLLLSLTNDGYARGNNKGLRLIENDPEVTDVLILNNDILFVQDIIPSLLRYYYKLSDAGIVSPLLYKKDLTIDLRCARKNTNIWIEIARKLFNYTLAFLKVDLSKRLYLLHDEKNIPELFPIELPSGSCMLINKQFFADIGFFDPNTFLYVEENILYKKIQLKGKMNYLCGNLKCIHLGGASTHASSSVFLLKCERDSFTYYWKQYEKSSVLLIILYQYAANQHRLLHMLVNKYIKKKSLSV